MLPSRGRRGQDEVCEKAAGSDFLSVDLGSDDQPFLFVDDEPDRNRIGGAGRNQAEPRTKFTLVGV
ncbi:MAG TPA: hypothetical protein DCP37_02570 [Dehalococcoidia bacterium]|nr:hypothetical protein [Dehalococcoidia bacterium]